MDTLMKADIFFFITTLAVALVGIILAVALVYVIIFMRDVIYISKRVREESDKIIEDVDALRLSMKSSVQSGAVTWRSALGFLRVLTHRRRSQRKEKAEE